MLLSKGLINNVSVLWGFNTNDSMRDIMEAECGHRNEGAPPVSSCRTVNRTEYLAGLRSAVGSAAAFEEAKRMYPPDPAGRDNLFRTGWYESDRFGCDVRARVRKGTENIAAAMR